MPYNREDAERRTRENIKRWAEENIERICAEQGLTVKIQDPVLLARLAAGLRVGKKRYDEECARRRAEEAKERGE